MPAFLSLWKMIAGGALMLVVLGFGIYSYLHQAPEFDELTERALLRVSETTSYTQDVITEVDVAGRHMTVAGHYENDAANNRYLSHATTTLGVPNAKGVLHDHTFTLENIAIDQNVYARVQTDSPIFTETIPHSTKWRHFTSSAIPEEFQNIAVPGPILDNLAIFGAAGAYLLPIASHGADAQDAMLMRYTFTLSPNTSGASGPVKAVIERIGSGTIDVWIDQTTAEIRIIEFTGEGYRSRTHISDINTPRTIEPPIDFSLSTP